MNLRELRLEHGLTQKQLADMVGVDHTTICAWERGRRSPQPLSISALAGVLHVELSGVYEAISADRYHAWHAVYATQVIGDGEDDRLIALCYNLEDADHFFCGRSWENSKGYFNVYSVPAPAPIGVVPVVSMTRKRSDG